MKISLNTDHSNSWMDEPVRCECGATIQSGMCMHSGRPTIVGINGERYEANYQLDKSYRIEADLPFIIGRFVRN